MIREPTPEHVDVRTLPLPTEPRPHGLSEFFEPLRVTRRERNPPRAPGARTSRRRAVLTMVHNEPAFLPIWLGYYGRFFAPEDIYVLDNDSTDGSTSGSGFVRIPVSHDRVDHTWMVRTIERHQHKLLDSYDVVLTTDVDELVAPRPELGGLGEYLERFEEEFVNCLGYEILHMKDLEDPLDLSRPILEQRGYWFANDSYDKPALATVPLRWQPGFHRLEDDRLDRMVLDPDLLMIHLHRVDFGICLERHRLRRNRAWGDEDLDAGWAIHNLIVDDAEFERWFYSEAEFPDRKGEIVLEPIPPSWRGVF